MSTPTPEIPPNDTNNSANSDVNNTSSDKPNEVPNNVPNKDSATPLSSEPTSSESKAEQTPIKDDKVPPTDVSLINHGAIKKTINRFLCSAAIRFY